MLNKSEFNRFNPRCLVLAHRLSGHTGTYTRLLVEALLEIEWIPCLLTSKKSLQIEHFHKSLMGLEDKVELHDVMPSFDRLSGRQNKRLQARFLFKYLSLLRPKHLILPTFDGLAVPLAKRAILRRGNQLPNTTAIVHNLAIGYGNRSISKRLRTSIDCFAIQRSGIETLFFVDDLALAETRKAIKSPRCVHLPDPVESVPRISKIDARDQLELPLDRFYFGIIGHLNRRKGVDLALRAFATAIEDLPTNATLLLAGQLSGDIRNQISNYGSLIDSSRIILVDKLIDYERLPIYLQACDVVLTIYPGHVGIASFLLRAAAANRPVIGLNEGWIGQKINKCELGWTIEGPNILSIQRKMLECIHEIDSIRPSFNQEWHDPRTFKKVIQGQVLAKNQLTKKRYQD